MPNILIGSLPLLVLNFAPNFLSGFTTLKKSLFERLLSPTIFILNGDLINKDKINLPNVPEFPAFNVKFFL